MASDPDYVLGYPIVVRVDLVNVEEDVDYLDLPRLGLFQQLDSVSLMHAPADDEDVEFETIHAASEMRERGLLRLKLLGGRAFTSVIDLAAFGTPLPEGRRRLKLALHALQGVTSLSDEVVVTFLQPSATEKAEAERLRGLLGMRPSAPWSEYVTRSGPPAKPEFSELGKVATRQILPFWRLRHVIQAEVPLSAFDVDVFSAIGSDSFAEEAALLDYEIARAKGVDAERLRASVQHAPGAAMRLEEIDRGAGLLTSLKSLRR
jgi:hypothetical protein